MSQLAEKPQPSSFDFLRHETTSRARVALAYLAMLGVGIAATWFFVNLSLPLRYPFSNDTAGYVEEATNFLAGRGLARTGRWSDVSDEVVPQAIFPPGFPLIIAAVASAGIGVREAALAVAWAVWALLFPAVFFAVRPLFARMWPTAAVAVVAAISPAVFDWGFQAVSDGPTLLLSVVAMGALGRAAGSGTSALHWAVISGLAAGAAYVVRNAAIIFPAVAFGTFAAAVVLRALPARVAIGRLVAWSCAAGLVVLPLLARNVLLFSALQPYFSGSGLPTTDYGWLRAFRLVLWSELLDLSGLRAVAQLAWSALWLLVLGIPLGALGVFLGIGWWRTSVPRERVAAAGLALFAVLGFAVVTAGRARIDWVETELTRHVMQYSWAVLALLGALILGGTAHHARFARQIAFAAVFGALLAGHAWFIWRDVEREATVAAAFARSASFSDAARSVDRPEWILTNRIKVAISHDEALKRYVSNLPQGTRIVSNFAETLSLETGRAVRPLPPDQEALAALDGVAQKLGAGRTLVAVFVPNNRALRSEDVAEWPSRMRSAVGPRFRVERESANLLILVHE